MVLQFPAYSITMATALTEKWKARILLVLIAAHVVGATSGCESFHG
jgi:hypothetical protein